MNDTLELIRIIKRLEGRISILETMENDMSDFLIEVAKGNVPGHSLVHKFGRNDDIDGPIEDIWQTGGIYVWKQAASTLEAISTDPNDTIAGSGARKIIVEGLNSSFEEISEEIEMNGVGASAATVLSFIRVNRAHVSEAGTYGGTDVGGNEGTITVTVSGAGATQCLIPLDNAHPHGQTLIARYTIPSGSTGFILSVHVNVDSGKTADIDMFLRQDADVIVAPMASPRVILELDAVSGGQDFNPDSPLDGILAEKTDIWFAAEAAANNTAVEVDFELLIVENAFLP